VLAKELERKGIPTALVTAMVSVATGVGASRIIASGRIPHTLGNPDLPPDREREWRKAAVKVALRALATPVQASTVFEVPA
jgi:glycine reductase complex component B subunit gamma